MIALQSLNAILHVVGHLHTDLQAQHRYIWVLWGELYQQPAVPTPYVQKANLLLLLRPVRIQGPPVHLFRASWVLEGMVRERIRMRSLPVVALLWRIHVALGAWVQVVCVATPTFAEDVSFHGN